MDVGDDQIWAQPQRANLRACVRREGRGEKEGWGGGRWMALSYWPDVINAKLGNIVLGCL